MKYGIIIKIHTYRGVIIQTPIMMYDLTIFIFLFVVLGSLTISLFLILHICKKKIFSFFVNNIFQACYKL